LPPVTKAALGYPVNPVQLLTLAKVLSLSMPEGALQRLRGSRVAQKTILKRKKEKNNTREK
jgi:hypothetical protein